MKVLKVIGVVLGIPLMALGSVLAWLVIGAFYVAAVAAVFTCFAGFLYCEAVWGPQTAILWLIGSLTATMTAAGLIGALVGWLAELIGIDLTDWMPMH